MRIRVSEIFLDMAIEELLKEIKPGSPTHERLSKILATIDRGTLPSASDMSYVSKLQSKEKPDCEYLTAFGGCKMGVAPKCPAVDKWKRGLIGCASYSALKPIDKLNENPFEPVSLK